ncbi:MAG: tRNA (adenosine(37)-N6)-threonylcarbamoyltransferase complex dimerization subunit type 1 TsaB [Ruminococcus sp.]|uniref:tRNA (adenosine(37)-N6)-threonylcarbamoyltransferase complex dimerization subunit type 1 TsaB n=1 Tax=Ruminococcus sp. TaxID=41978 RepID=UPI0028732BE7|nr:tRNA (adenosine(37)-N6)-threonylcarbamoyltransferase complex dimerization subunit type 1 TsaB [Ruminococcus sp.]MBQ3284073.1 tRNA (adenosine(37)-N6)-threonylcarbamoyltransferase complex dimerization subunit type 1 TsaB [Ruminococcus sp.]
MLMLSVDSSAAPASVCLLEDGKVIADYYLNTGFTHSQTLMAMTESVLKISGRSASDIDVYAVNSGPGSFTGVRIGVSAVKGMAYAADKPCIEVSTLESMAYNSLGSHAVICACMDARRQQVYNALFRVDGVRIERLCDDRAISIDELLTELNTINGEIILVGDGAELVFSRADNPAVQLAAPNLRYQRASSAAAAALEKYNRGESVSPAALTPRYLRLSQAERERNAKQSEKDGTLV